MKIRVAFVDADLTLAAVHIAPNWIEWLLGAREFDDLARRVGRGEWVWDSPFGGPITVERVIDAIEREHAVRVVERRIADLRRGVYP